MTGLLYIKGKKEVHEMAGRTSLPRKVFLTHYDRLQEAIISPVRLAGKLLAKDLIETATNSNVITDAVPCSTKAAWILEDVRVVLETSNQPGTVLKAFCDVLDDSGAPALGGIAASMRSSLDGKVLSDVQYFYNVIQMLNGYSF